MSKDKPLMEKILKVVSKIVNIQIKDDEVIVIMYGNPTNWAVQLYPKQPDLDMVGRLLSNFLLQVKALKDKLEKEEEDKKRIPYTI